jgi:antitoxin (DNA-binding transcriptional repressor) of toxin-antitoxin stability system
MSRELTLEELRERPDELIDAIEKGEAVTITRDGKQIASVGPTIIRRADPRPLRDIKISPLSKPLDVDVVAELIAERDRERSDKKWRP